MTKKTKERLVSYLLSIILVMTLVLPMIPAVEVKADYTENPTTKYQLEPSTSGAIVLTAHVVTFAGIQWYVIGYADGDVSTGAAITAGAITLLKKDVISEGAVKFANDNDNTYANSNLKYVLGGYADSIFSDAEKSAIITRTLTGGNTTGDSNSDYVSGDPVDAKLWPLSASEANKLSLGIRTTGSGKDWWLRSPSNYDDSAAFVLGGDGGVLGIGFIVYNPLGVRPALWLNLESVTFESSTKTFTLGAGAPATYSVTLSGGNNATPSGGSTTQNDLSGAMETVTYTANTGYHFEAFDPISSNGITATRTNETTVTVSGTPTGIASITIPNAVANAPSGPVYNPASGYDFTDLVNSDTTVQIPGVKYNGTDVADWYVIGYRGVNSDAAVGVATTPGAVTLLAKQSLGEKKFNSNEQSGNAYGTSEIKTYVEGLTGAGQPLASIKDALASIAVTGDPNITGAVPYLLSTGEANAIYSQNTNILKLDGINWWLRSPGNEGSDRAALVFGGISYVDGGGVVVYSNLGVRPAIQLDLSKVPFNSETKIFSSESGGGSGGEQGGGGDPVYGGNTGSGGSGSGSGAGAGDSSSQYTIPVENGATEGSSGTVNIAADISGNTAKVSDISASDVQRVADATPEGENASVVIDLSGASSSVDSVELTKDTVDTLADATGSQDTAVDSLEVKLPTGEVQLDAVAVQSVSEQAKGDTVTIGLTEKSESQLEEAQSVAIKAFGEVSKIFSATIKSGNGDISNFGGGTARIKMPNRVAAGKNPNFYHVYYVSILGALERMVTTHTQEDCRYKSGHCSDYVIVYDENDINENIAPIDKIVLKKSKLTYTGKKQSAKISKVIAASVDDIEVPTSAYDLNVVKGTKTGKYQVTVTAKDGSDFRGSAKTSYKIVKGKTNFKLKASATKVKAGKKAKAKSKSQTVTMTVSGLTKGSAKPTFAIKSVTKGQKKNVSIDKKTGTVTIKKGTKPCKIKVVATSKANKNRKAKSKTITIKVTK